MSGQRSTVTGMILDCGCMRMRLIVAEQRPTEHFSESGKPVFWRMSSVTDRTLMPLGMEERSVMESDMTRIMWGSFIAKLFLRIGDLMRSCQMRAVRSFFVEVCKYFIWKPGASRKLVMSALVAMCILQTVMVLTNLCRSVSVSMNR